MSARCSPDLARKMDNLKCNNSIKVKHMNPRFNPYDSRKPKGRSGHCMNADECNMYVFGGYSPSDDRNGVTQSQVLPELWKFNFASQKWMEIKTENIPTTCASSSLLVMNKKMFVFGGTGYPFGHIMSNTIKALNLNPQPVQDEDTNKGNEEGTTKLKNCWYLLETNPMSYSAGGDTEDTGPRPAYGQSVIFHKDAVYVFAGAVGFYSEAISDLHKFSFYTMTWERLRPTGKVPSGRFYVLGGGRLHHSEGLDKIYIYHIARNHWTEETAKPDKRYGFPKARCSFGCAQYKNDVYISGGRHYGETVEHQPLKDIWCLQLDTLKWTKSQIKLPIPLYFHGSVVSPSGDMYIFGGVQPDGFRSPYLYKVRLPFTVPKLSEMCWGKVCELSRNHKALRKEELIKMGVPWTFIDRLELPARERKKKET